MKNNHSFLQESDMTASRRRIRKIFVPCIATVNILLSCATSSWADTSQKQIAPDKATAVIHCSYAPVTYWDPNTGKPINIGWVTG